MACNISGEAAMTPSVETTLVQFSYAIWPDFDFSTLIGDAGALVFGHAKDQSARHAQWLNDTTAMIDRDGVRIIVAMTEPETAADSFTLTVAVGPSDVGHAALSLLRAAAGLCQTIATAVADHCPADLTEWRWLPQILTPHSLAQALAQLAAPAVASPVRPTRIRAGHSRHNRPVSMPTDKRHIRPERPASLVARSAQHTRPARLTNTRRERLAIASVRLALQPDSVPAPKQHARLSAHLMAMTGLFMSLSNTAFAHNVLGWF